MPSHELQLLGASDLPRLVAFLSARLDTSLFLLSNLERAGIVDHAEQFQATYVGAFEDGELVSVAAHCWNGILLVQGDAGLEAAAAHAIGESGRRLEGLIGPWKLLSRLFVSLDVPRTEIERHLPEILFSLPLDALCIPASLQQRGMVLRVPTEDEVDASLVTLRLAYEAEALGVTETPERRQAARADLHASRQREDCFILLDHGRLVAFTAFNARAQGVVQVGGVFTPPLTRSRGYARAAVAGSLLRARSQGMTRSVLFTACDNFAAQRCYRALGFSEVGEYGVVLFADSAPGPRP